MAHICVSKLTIIGSDNGLSPGRRQVIIGTNAGILLIGPLGRNFNEILIEIHTFSFNKRQSKMSSAKRPPFCLGLNVLSIQRLWNDKKHTHKTKKTHKKSIRFRLWHCHPGNMDPSMMMQPVSFI